MSTHLNLILSYLGVLKKIKFFRFGELNQNLFKFRNLCGVGVILSLKYALNNLAIPNLIMISIGINKKKL